MIAQFLRRLGALIAGPPRTDFGQIPPSLMRDVGLEGPHLIGTAPAPDGIAAREGANSPARPPFSFRIHPASELVEFRDRSSLASLPVFRQKGAQPQAV